jgi:hypothetical protein
VVVERVAERAVMGEWILLVSGMAGQVWELNKAWEAYMTWSHGCQMIFPHQPSQRHPWEGHGNRKSRGQKE